LLVYMTFSYFALTRIRFKVSRSFPKRPLATLSNIHQPLRRTDLAFILFIRFDFIESLALTSTASPKAQGE
jgi:hypothetical protein